MLELFEARTGGWFVVRAAVVGSSFRTFASGRFRTRDEADAEARRIGAETGETVATVADCLGESVTTTDATRIGDGR